MCIPLRAVFVFVATLLVSHVNSSHAADLILHHGRIVTVDAKFTISEAIAVTGDRIVAVGSNDDIRKLATAQTRQVDLGGKMVIPGLADSHVHPTGAAMYEFDHPIPEMDTIADLLKYIESRTQALEPGAWITIHQVFITRLRDQRYPTRKELDLVAPKHPVIFSTGPDSVINSLAMQLSGIDRNYKLPDGSPGRIERDAAGEPTGMLRNCSGIVKVKDSDKSATAADERRRLKEMLAAYNAVGITSIADRDAGDGAVRLYQSLRDKGELTCRVFVNYSISAGDSLEKIAKQIDVAAKHPLHQRDNWLWLRGIKVYLDGGMLTGSAYMRQPWGVSKIYSITDPEYRGLLFIQPDKLKAIARLALTNDLQMTAHAVGDGAVHTLINAYAELNREFPVRDKRPCITHCNFMSADAIAKMKELGLVADLQPAWLWLDGKTLTDQFGNDRLAYFQPYKSLFENGVTVGGGSDHMQKLGSLRSVNPYNPFLGMWITLTRQPRRTDLPLHPEQRITREQALRLYTINNAYLMFQEQDKGSLEPGKLADLVVLKQDLLTCELDAVRTTEVEQTYVGGKLVYPPEAK